jgi:hypothetical protein
MGIFSISVYSRLTAARDQILIRWVLDMAEGPSDATVKLIDADGNLEITEREKADYFGLWQISILDEIELAVDGRELPKHVDAYELTVQAGEQGAPYVRLVMDLSVEMPRLEDGETRRCRYRDQNYIRYFGWREVVVQAARGIDLVESSVPSQDRTNELRVYPNDLLAIEPQSEATFAIRPRAAAEASSGPTPAPDEANQDGSGFSFWPTGFFALLVIAAMVVWGAHEQRGAARRR